jgi:hypothetical protein
MFSWFLSVELALKYAERVITIGFSPSGSISANFVWIQKTCTSLDDLAQLVDPALDAGDRLLAADRHYDVGAFAERLDSLASRLHDLLLAGALALHERHPELVVVALVELGEAVGHAEGEGHEERLVGVAGELGVPVEYGGRGLRREDRGDRLLELRRWPGGEHSDGLRVGRVSEVPLDLVPVPAVLARDRAVLDGMPAVEMPEDALLGDVGRARPIGDPGRRPPTARGTCCA